MASWDSDPIRDGAHQYRRTENSVDAAQQTYRAVSAVKVARYLQCGMETLPPRSPTCSISKMFMKLQRVYLDCQSTYAEVTQAVAHTVVAPVRIALTP